MADDGLTTGQIPTTELIDDLVGNREGGVRRILTEHLAAQLAETGAMAAKFSEHEDQVDQAVTDAEEAVSDAQLIKDYIGGAVFPIGAVAIFPVDSMPSTFLAMEGQAVTSDYPDLRQLLIDGGSLWGTDGSGDPLLPDTRGEFIRGWDNARGVDVDRDLGSSQLDQMQRITGSFVNRTNNTGISGGAFTTSSTSETSRHEGSGAGVQTVSFDSGDSPEARVGDETRPRNIAMIYAIKAFHAYADLTGKLIDPATVEETTQLKLEAISVLESAEEARTIAEASADQAAISANITYFPADETARLALSPSSGERAFQQDAQQIYEWNGSSWDGPYDTGLSSKTSLDFFTQITGDFQDFGGSMFTGSTVVGGNYYVLADELDIGTPAELVIGASGAGTIILAFVAAPDGTDSGDAYTLVDSTITLDVVDGVNTISLLDVEGVPDIESAGHYFAVKSGTADVKLEQSYSPGTPYKSIGSIASGTFGAGTGVAGDHINARLSVMPPASIRSSLAVALGKKMDSAEYEQRAGAWDWGTLDDLSDTGSDDDMPDRTFVFPAAFEQAVRVQYFTLYARAAGTVSLRSFSLSGSTYTQTNEVTVTVPGSGVQTIYLDEPLDIAAGEHFGFYGSVGTMVYDGDGRTSDFGGYHYATGDKATFTDANVRPSYRFLVRLGLITGGPDGYLLDLDRRIGVIEALDVPSIEERVETLEASGGADWDDTTGFIIVWGVGQSNMAGRAEDATAYTVPSGRGYMFKAGTGLVDVEEPTGNDGTTEGSLGSALCYAVLSATNGRIGVIFINTAVGGTGIVSNWGDGQTVWNNAKSRFTNTLTEIEMLELNVVGCIGAIVQGETDGDNSMSATDYENGFLDLLSRMQAHTGMGERFKLVMTQTGTKSTGDTTGYATIRQAQANLAIAGDVLMAHSGAKYFAGRGLMSDTFHYTAAGYDEIGLAMGEAIACYGIGSRPTGLSE
ncbi:sialate O-acetylesterase [Oceanicola sp. S124]|uniref:sialate O-acetylesterase n=1 Tax=Oceanicola sp. S124 TaxID=1042378 RepID=UPI000255866C|nr:sialate O-acetylesterase [Oceanicola sp. S124]